VADASIDGNANVGTKDITSLTTEMNKPHSKLLAFNKIFYEMNKKYGYKVASDWLHNEWDGHFYLHDSHSSTWVPYCFAYDIENLVKKGLYFVKGFNAQPPQHLTTYTDFVGEFVSWASNRSSGACGLPSFLVYSFYFWKKDIEEGYFIKSPEYYRDQEFQRIVYKLNQPYLRVNQSAFTNFSIFDRDYLIEIFGGKEFPDGSFVIDYIEEIIEYQKKKHTVAIFSSILAVLSIVSVILNILLTPETPWSSYVVTTCGILWLLSIQPFILRMYLTKFHSVMATFGSVTLFTLLAEIIIQFLPHSIIFDCLNTTIGITAFILFTMSLVASKNKRFREWCRKKFYF
jgi:hypothetical protein